MMFKRLDLKLKFLSVALCLTFALIALLGTKVYADDSSTRSVTGDYFNKVFSIELNNGTNLIEELAPNSLSKRETLNNQIYNGTVSKNYSLYDRFGGNVKFIPYYGEIKISTGLLDRFYTKFVDNDDEFTLSSDDITKLFTNSAISNNAIYENRPNILSSESIAANSVDPRVSKYSGISSTGGSAALGNLMLSISNSFTTAIGWLSGSNVYEAINSTWLKISPFIQTNILNHLIYLILPLAMCIFVFRMVTYGVGVVKGNFNFKTFFEQMLSACLSLGIIFTLMFNPMFLSSTLTRVISIVDSTMDSTIKINSDEVIKSDNLSNIRLASLWEKTIFNNWCNGMFGQDYAKLYTQYDTNTAHFKMAQSHDDVKAAWSNKKIKYNSASLTGDVKIQVGPNSYVQNWAALAWSTQSIYHIDAVKSNSSVKTSVSKTATPWPKATATPMNDQIFVDNFRWLDAKLNISPQYSSTDKITMNYSDSNKYRESFVSSGFKSVYMTLLLIPIAILTLRKLVNSLKIVLFGYSLCYQSVMNLVIPDRYSLSRNLSKLGKSLYDFLWWSITVLLAIVTYTKMAGNNAIGDFIWLIVGIYLCKVRPIRTPRQLKYFVNNVRGKSKEISNNVMKKLETRRSKKVR